MRKKLLLVLLFLSALLSCRKPHNNTNAFYYWKTNFQLSPQQNQLLKQSGTGKLYIRFFDVQWDSVNHRAIPTAVVNFQDQPKGYQVTPVVYITNKTFEKTNLNEVDSLATKCNGLVSQIAGAKSINYKSIQIDCDWNLNTKEKYFRFLTTLKSISHHATEATIRLHQVKYRNLTGVPPVDRGVLMFYNMGQVNANLKQRNSIYNAIDAEKYLANLGSYPLPLDVALPAFSWGIQIRDGRVIQIYEKITRELLTGNNFFPIKGTNCYVAKNSFFWGGIYIKQSDIFKLEEADTETLNRAAQQLSKKLSAQQNRSIIFYELANLNTATFNANTVKEVSDNF